MSVASLYPVGHGSNVPHGADLLQTLIDASPNPITYCEAVWQTQSDQDPQLIDFIYRLGNQTLYTFLGKPADAVLGGHISLMAPFMATPDWLERFAQVVQTGCVQQIEYCHQTDEFANWYLIQVSPMLAGVMLSLTDITALKQRETHLQTVIDQAHTGIIMIRPVREEPVQPDQKSLITDFEITLVNQAQARYLGQTPQALMGTLASQYFTAYKDVGLFTRYCQVIETGIAQRFEQHYTGDGIDVWVDIQATPLEGQVLITFSDHSALKKTQFQLLEQTQLLQDVLAASPVAVALLTPRYQETGTLADFQVSQANQALGQLIGLSVEELIGSLVSNWFSDYTEAGLFAEFREVLKTDQPSHWAGYYTRPDGRRWLDISIVPQRGGLVVNWVDNTHLKETLGMQEQLTSLLQGVLNSSPTSIRLHRAVRDEQGKIIDFILELGNENSPFRHNRLGQGTQGKRLLTVYPHLKENGLFERYVQVVETNQSIRFEIPYYADGVAGWFDCTAVRQGDGFVLTTLDITASKKAQLEQQKATSLLQSVLDASVTGMVLVDSVRDKKDRIVDFRFRLANKVFLQAARRSAEQMIGLTILQIHPYLQGSGVLERYVEVVESGKPQQMEQVMPTRNGQVWLSVAVFPQGDGLVISFTDITSLKQAQQKLEEAIAALKQSNQNLQQFAYVASHDLQEPLRKIHSFGDVLREQYTAELSPSAVDLIQRMQSAAVRMQTLIKDLLTYSRLSNKTEGFKSIDLNMLLAEVVGDLEAAIVENQARVQIDNLPNVPSDSLQLRQLFQNLLGNALKFTRSNTSPQIQVKAYPVKATQLPGSLAAEGGNWVAIEVQDNGIGFEEKHLDRIFELFQRLHGRTGTYPGTGMGLAICKRIVENHGGYLTARSQPDQGATFVVYLPIEDKS